MPNVRSPATKQSDIDRALSLNELAKLNPTHRQAKTAMTNVIKQMLKRDAAHLVPAAKAVTQEAVEYLYKVLTDPNAEPTLKVQAAGRVISMGWANAPTKLEATVTNVDQTRVITAADLRQAALRLVKSTAETVEAK